MSFKDYHNQMNEIAKQLAKGKHPSEFARLDAPPEVLSGYLPTHLQYRGLLPIDFEMSGVLHPESRRQWENEVRDRFQFSRHDSAQTLLAHIYAAHDGKMMEVTKPLSDTLQLVDVSPSIPACYIAPPFPVTYFAFEDHGIKVDFGNEIWTLDGIMMVESSVGDALAEGRIKINHTKHDVLSLMSRRGMVDLQAPEDLKVVSVVIVGRSPFQLMQHPCFFFEFVYQAGIETTIGQTISVFNDYLKHAHEDRALANYNSQDFEADLRIQNFSIDWLTRLLLYVNAHPEDREALNPHSELMKKVRGTLSKTKAKTLKEQADRVCDVIVLGGGLCQELKADLAKTDDNGKRHNATHWRRGHIRRQRYGPGRSEIKLIMIPPVLVNKDLGMPVHRDYQLK